MLAGLERNRSRLKANVSEYTEDTGGHMTTVCARTIRCSDNVCVEDEEQVLCREVDKGLSKRNK